MAELLPCVPIRTPSRALLHDAAKGGDTLQLDQALDEFPAAIDQLQFGFAPIHLAAKGGHLDALTLLIDRRADVNARAGNNATPLHCAAEMDRPEAIALLLLHGAELHALANMNDAALHYAALNGRLAATRLLVAKGADVQAKNALGLTPWDDAIRADKGRCACQDPAAREWTMVAAFLAHVSLLAPEVREAFAQRACERPAAAVLHDAAELGNTLDLARVLESGACDLKAKDYDGSTAVHAAVEGGHVGAVSLLLDWRADVSATNNYQDTALHLAARDGHLSITRLLVAKGASVHAQNRFQMTPLELAMRHKRAGWEAVTAFLREEALDIRELPPAARAMRKIRKAFHSQPPPNGLRKLEPCLAPPQPPPPALRDVAAEPVIPSSGADVNKGRRAPLRYRPAAASAEAEAEPQQYT